MKNIVKIFLTVLFFIISLGVSFADQCSEELSLGLDEVVTLKTPETKAEILAVANQNCELTSQRESEDSGYFHPEEDLGTSKAEKAFYNFVNNKIINNKLNIYSMYFGEEHKARAP